MYTGTVGARQMVQLNHPQLGNVEATDLDFEPPDEEWRTYELADGTSLKVKTVVNKVFRIEDHPNQLGEPMYQISTQNLVRANDVPEELLANTSSSGPNDDASEDDS